MNDIKRIDLTEFRDEGFLQEVNRKFFHPLGLALEVIMEADGTVSKIGGVWDYRDDPEGMFFGEDMIKQEKIDKVEALRVSKIETRKAVEDFKTDENGIQI